VREADATLQTPGYVFIAVESHGYIRYYPVRLSADHTP
jgi:hypothetical protein